MDERQRKRWGEYLGVNGGTGTIDGLSADTIASTGVNGGAPRDIGTGTGTRNADIAPAVLPALERMPDAGRPMAAPVDEARLREFGRILNKYKAGKASVERRAIEAESWWKMRNQIMRERNTAGIRGFNAKSGWLHNVVVQKHADILEAYPEPNILPREQGDAEEAKKLSAIIPVVLEQNNFDDVYSEATWQKLKTGTGIYKVYWDADKYNGLGDIAIDRVDILNVFWEPGVADIQKSKYFFHTNVMDNDVIQEMYPETTGKLGANSFVPQKFSSDDSVSMDNKSTVIDCYYKTFRAGRQELHYCKYVGSTILYSSENIGTPLYDHGLYPFVFDALYPIEGSPGGYGFVDLGSNIQEQLDMTQTAMIQNAMVGAIPRYFQRSDGSVNEEEFLDLSKPLVHVDGNLGTDALRLVDYKPLSGNYLTMRENTIEELRQTTGNTEASNGNTPSGVTAASAIAALQEASGKGARDATRTTYRAYRKIVNLVIELIRQFYDLPREFRITGEQGREEFVSYSNAGLATQSMGDIAGQEMYRLPVFDIKVDPAKRTAYSRISQNELALQFYQSGFFNPQMTDQALSCLSMMEFDQRDSVMQMIARNGTMQQQLMQYQQLALALTQKYEPQQMQALMQTINGGAQVQPRMQETGGDKAAKAQGGEDSRMVKARAQSREASQI